MSGTISPLCSSHGFSTHRHPTHEREIYVINPCGPLASRARSSSRASRRSCVSPSPPPLNLGRVEVNVGDDKHSPPDRYREGDSRPSPSKTTKEQRPLPVKSFSSSSISHRGTPAVTEDATTSLPYPEKIACGDLETVVSSLVSLACCPRKRRHVLAFLCVFEQFKIDKAALFDSLISCKEANESKDIGKKEGVVFVVKEWMGLFGRNYFETDENFMRHLLAELSQDPCFAKTMERLLAPSVILSPSFSSVSSPTSFTSPLRSAPHFRSPPASRPCRAHTTVQKNPLFQHGDSQPFPSNSNSTKFFSPTHPVKSSASSSSPLPSSPPKKPHNNDLTNCATFSAPSKIVPSVSSPPAHCNRPSVLLLRSTSTVSQQQKNNSNKSDHHNNTHRNSSPSNLPASSLSTFPQSPTFVSFITPSSTSPPPDSPPSHPTFPPSIRPLSPSTLTPSSSFPSSFPPPPSPLPLPKEEDLFFLLSISLFELGGVREIADKVTYYMWKSYKMISPSELFDGHWQGKKREKEAPNIHKLGSIFNQFSSVCAIAILSAPEDDRSDTLIKVIELAYLLKKMHNYEGMGAVGGVFGQASIQRLKPLWASLPKKVIAKRRDVERLLNPQNNYGELEKHISHARSEGFPCIPLIAPRLRTLRYLYDSQSKIEDGMIDFSFLLKTGGQIHKVLRSKKGRSYSIQVTEHSTDPFTRVLETDLDIDFNDLEDSLYERSKTILER